MIDIYDDVLEEHNAILVDDAIKQLSWKYNYHSQPNKPNKHWHILCGHNEEECNDAGFDWAHSIFTSAMYKYKFKEKYDVESYLRAYMNGYTYGIEPQMHTDDGDFTMIYYPDLNWKSDKCGGGTMIDGEVVNYVGNRLVVFDAHLPHMAMPLLKECYDLRINVVFKCVRNAVKGGKFKVQATN